MNTKAFLTKWIVITALLGLAYMSHHTYTSESQTKPPEQEIEADDTYTREIQPEPSGQEIKAGDTYTDIRRRILIERKRKQLEWQMNNPEQYNYFQKQQLYETYSH